MRQGTDLLARIIRPRALDAAAPGVRERCVLSAQIALLLAGVAAIGVTANLVLPDPALVTGSALLLVVTAGTPALLAAGRLAAARMLLVAGSPLLMLGPAFLAGTVQVANLAALPYAVLTMSLLPSLVWEPRAERGPRAACNAYLLVVLLAHDVALARLADLPAPPLNAKLAQGVLWLLMLASLRFAERAPDSEST